MAEIWSAIDPPIRYYFCSLDQHILNEALFLVKLSEKFLVHSHQLHQINEWCTVWKTTSLL